MKKRLFFILCMITSCHVKAQGPNVVGTFGDGHILQPADTLHDKDMCIFSLDSGADAEWAVYMECHNGPREVAMSTGRDITLNVTPRLLGADFYERQELRKYYDGSGSVLNKGYAQAVTEKGERCSMPFVIRVFPRKPRVISAHLEYSAFDETCNAPGCGWFWGTSIAPEVQVYDARWVSWHAFYAGTNAVWILSDGAFDGDGVVTMNPASWDIDMGIYACVSNEYGVAYSDTVFINDHIPPHIMDVIDRYYEWANHIEDASGNCGAVSQMGPGERIISVEMFDVNGRLISKSSGNACDMLKSNHGMAILRINTNKRTITRKIVQR